jgi:GNAT superfamily N-acetyltransferase
MLVIEPIQNKKDIASFIDFVYDLYKGDTNFVPELFIAQRDHINPKKNPFFDTAKAQLFLAKRDGKVVGRIAAVRDENLIEFTGEPTGVFGFFDVIDDYKVAEALLNAASDWLKKEGLHFMEGPYNFSVNHTCGVLIDGYQYAPKVMMTYNKPYYKDFLESYGLEKKMDLLAYHLDSNKFPERLQRAAKLIEEKLEQRGITVRKMNLKHFIEDVKSTVHVYNQAWSKNLGYTPMSEKEFLHAAKDMKLIMDPELVMLAEKDGKVIGFSLTLPDINEIQQTIPRGRLLPFGIFKLLFNKKNIKGTRIIALGVLEEFRRTGLDAYFYIKTFEYVKNHPVFQTGEASWILENNPEMNQAIIKMGGEVQKRYRIFRKAIA